MSLNPRSIANMVKTYIEARGWNQAETAKHFRVKPANVSSWLRGLHPPDDDRLTEIANFLKKNPKQAILGKHLINLQNRGIDLGPLFDGDWDEWTQN